MELNGEEKTIRALFREMKLEDERAKLTFARQWKPGAVRSGTRLSLGRVVFAVAVGCVILVSTLVMRRQFFETEPLGPELPTQLASDGRSSAGQVLIRDETSPLKKEGAKLKNPAVRRRTFAGASKNERIATKRRRGYEAYVSDWQSPTRAFLRSPGEELLRSFRPLNQSSVELGSFLHNRLN